MYYLMGRKKISQEYMQFTKGNVQYSINIQLTC